MPVFYVKSTLGFFLKNPGGLFYNETWIFKSTAGLSEKTFNLYARNPPGIFSNLPGIILNLHIGRTYLNISSGNTPGIPLICY